MLHQIEIFEAQTGIKLKVKDGKPYYNSSLYWISDELPDNLVVDGNLDCFSMSTKLPKGLMVKGYLCISYTTITEIPDDCEFGGLIISNTEVTKLRDNLKLDRLMACNSLLTELPKGLKVKGELNISNTKITKIPHDCEFGSLDISDTKITTLRDNLTLYFLIIKNTPIEKLPKNLVVFNHIVSKHTKIKEIPDDCLTNSIRSDVNLNNEQYENGAWDYYFLKNEIVHINHPSGREFLHVDNLLSEVIEKKGNVYHIRTGVNDPISYVVTYGNGNWAHGNTLEVAKQDLIYKISKRDKSEYEKLTINSELTFDEAVACYRVITGACRLGTNDYLEHRLPEPHKEKYTIKEIIELTKDEYGGQTFLEFFEK